MERVLSIYGADPNMALFVSAFENKPNLWREEDAPLE